MRKLVGVLAVITAIFAGSTLYLAYELRVEQQRALASSTPRETPQPLVEPQPSSGLVEPGGQGDATPTGGDATPAGVAVESLANADTQTSRASPSVDERRALAQRRYRAQRQEAYTKLLKQYEDPLEREKMLANARAEERKRLGRFPQLAGLTEEETNGLTAVLAQQQVESSVKVAQCFLDATCTTPQRALAALDKNARSQQVADLLGPENAERYQFYQSSLQERSGVTSLRAKLPDNHLLADADAERLIEALARERHKYVSEAEQAGVAVGSLGAGGNGSLFYRRDQATGGQRGRFSADMASAVDFSERMRKTASPILTAEQMRVFNAMQDDLLSILRQRSRPEQTRPPSQVRE